MCIYIYIYIHTIIHTVCVCVCVCVCISLSLYIYIYIYTYIYIIQLHYTLILTSILLAQVVVVMIRDRSWNHYHDGVSEPVSLQQHPTGHWSGINYSSLLRLWVPLTSGHATRLAKVPSKLIYACSSRLPWNLQVQLFNTARSIAYVDGSGNSPGWTSESQDRQQSWKPFHTLAPILVEWKGGVWKRGEWNFQNADSVSGADHFATNEGRRKSPRRPAGHLYLRPPYIYIYIHITYSYMCIHPMSTSERSVTLD